MMVWRANQPSWRSRTKWAWPGVASNRRPRPNRATREQSRRSSAYTGKSPPTRCSQKMWPTGPRSSVSTLPPLHGVHLLVTESSGAMSAPLVAILRALAQCVKLPDACDTTVYGSSRAAPRSFYPHHLAAISAAIVQADALALTNAAAAQNCALTLHVRNDRL